MKKKVLFVDDDLLLGCVLSMAMKNAGYDLQYHTALTGIESIILSWRPDIIILDIEIGEENGLDAAKTIRRIRPDIPIIFESSHIDSEYEEKALRNGGKYYLKKPFEIDLLIDCIERFTKREEEDVHIGIFTVNWKIRTLSLKRLPVAQMSPMETKLLQYFLANKNVPVTRETIMQYLWPDQEPLSSEQSLNNYVAKLRRYLSDDPRLTIENIPSIGYKFTIPSTAL